MPTFECPVYGKKIRSEYEISCTDNVKRDVEKAHIVLQQRNDIINRRLNP